jgi:phosphoribosyl-ATP pyrophosphohydrolase
VADDLLSAIFERQLALQKSSYGGDPNDLPFPEKINYIRVMALALEDEVHEALNETAWKTWQASEHINRDAYVGELVDALHFLVNLALAVGVSPDEFAERYFEKATKNEKRMADGYDGVSSKCPQCKRDMNDRGVKCVAPGSSLDVQAGYCDKLKMAYSFTTGDGGYVLTN